MWLSTHMLFQYYVLLLKYYIRSISDKVLQQILNIMRKLNQIEEDLEFVATSICTYCNFADNWNEVKPHVIRVTPKRKAVSKILKDYLQKIIEDKNIRTAISNSRDQYQQGDSWQELKNKNHIN